MGTGAFSEVKLAIEKATGTLVAIKMLDKFKLRERRGCVLFCCFDARADTLEGRARATRWRARWKF